MTPRNRQVTPIPHSSAFAYVEEWHAYAMDRSIGRPASDLYLVDLATGARTKLKDKVDDGYAQIKLYGDAPSGSGIETFVMNWRYVGGAAGIQIQRPPVMAPFDSYVKMLFFVQALLVVIAVAIARYIQNSRIGRGLQALRDDELAAECTGVPTLKLKLIATTLSGGFMGMAGAPLPFYVTYLDPASGFSLNYAVNAIAMPLIGGTANWVGPVVGALLVGGLQQYVGVTIRSEANVLVTGLLLVIFVILAPQGIIGLFQRKKR